MLLLYSAVSSGDHRWPTTTIPVVTRGGTGMIAALLAAVLAAAALSACGGGSDSDTTSQTAPRESASGGKGQGQGSKSKKEELRGKLERAGKQKGSESPREVNTAPLRVSGGGSEKFRIKGGDNSIQEFGEESDESELQRAAEALHGFYVARAEERWARACSYLSESLTEQLEQLASRSKELDGKSCAATLAAFTVPLPEPARRESTVVDAASLREEGERGFLIYRGEEGDPFAMLMYQEDGEWKVAALAGTPLT